MKKGKYFIVPVPVWDTQLLISIEQSDSDFKKTMGKFFNEGKDNLYRAEDRAGSLVLDQYDDPIAIRLIDNPKTTFDGKGSLAHELNHAVQFMLDYRGLRRSRDSEEAYAYTTSYLTREIYKRL